MMKRRSFLVGASALAVGQLASGCKNQQASLKVLVLQDSLPAQLLGEFRKTLKQPATLKFDPEQQLQDLLKRLKTWKEEAEKEKQAEKKDNQPRWSLPFIGNKTPAIANLVTLGDYWLETAIKEQLIQPLKIEDLNGWKQLPPRWQELVKRNDLGQLDKSGKVWAAPYRWGTTVIAYNREKFKDLGWTPKDWSDLWRPELRDRISLLDQPREVIGLTLKKLGASYNTTDLSQVPNLKEELLKLHQQVKFYSSNNYLQPLLLEDTWVAVGWSTDVLPLRTSYRQIEAIVPQSGTALWADLWVQPASVSDGTSTGGTGDIPSLTKQWIDFCWQPTPAREISLFSKAASPMLTNVKSAELPKDLQQHSALLPAPSVFDKSDFLKPLPESAVKEYQALWKEIRASKVAPR